MAELMQEYVIGPMGLRNTGGNGDTPAVPEPVLHSLPRSGGRRSRCRRQCCSPALVDDGGGGGPDHGGLRPDDLPGEGGKRRAFDETGRYRNASTAIFTETGAALAPDEAPPPR
jgi:hypothetical protein